MGMFLYVLNNVVADVNQVENDFERRGVRQNLIKIQVMIKISTQFHIEISNEKSFFLGTHTSECRFTCCESQ